MLSKHQKRNINEKKLKALEKETTDALEMAEKENEKGKAQKSPEIRITFIYHFKFHFTRITS